MSSELSYGSVYSQWRSFTLLLLDLGAELIASFPPNFDRVSLPFRDAIDRDRLCDAVLLVGKKIAPTLRSKLE